MSDGIVRAVPKTYRAPKARKRLGKNEDRAAAQFEKAFHSSEYVGFVHEQDCAVPGCRNREIEFAHCGKTRKNGGLWHEGAPLCGGVSGMHHREQERIGTEAFNRKYGVDLLDIAARLALRWREKIKPTTTEGL